MINFLKYILITFWFCFGSFVSSDRKEVPASLDPILADASKPAVVLDPVTDKEVPLGELNRYAQGTS